MYTSRHWQVELRYSKLHCALNLKHAIVNRFGGYYSCSFAYSTHESTKHIATILQTALDSGMSYCIIVIGYVLLYFLDIRGTI